ncbi:MAG: dTMP kinase [Candidatus Heimdallarchaeota archaeon]|nr:dTMP kinase [Candidatus Heimdallarchaeota archaeon]MCK4973465.1 dTMP kinase [Candidatus Heimdallarchaeota archaeon]
MSDTSYPGLFICFEGIDGSGKTTHSRLIVERLCILGYDAVYTTEPTKWSEPGKKLRESFFAPTRLPVEDEFKLFLKDRMYHVKSEVIPLLNDGKIVVTDRYYFSSVAYQGARGLDWHYILKENEKIAIAPHLVIFLDVPVDVALDRIASERKEGINTFEKEESLRKVKDIYLLLADKFPKLIAKVDATKEISEIQKDVLKLITKVQNNKK